MPLSVPPSPTGVVLLNLGGPADLDAVEPFLLRLFEDREIIQLPFQRWLGPFIAKRRAPKVRKLYEAIGGGSPILRHTEAQGRGLCERLDRLSPGTAPHRHYIAFRYAPPFSDDALRAMQADGVERVVALTMYPQYSCTTTGSSLNELWRASDRTGLRDAFTWSLLDRWPTHQGFVEAMAETVRDGLARFAPEVRNTVPVLFSAHSLPMNVIARGDTYPQEVSATVERVVSHLGLRNPHLVTYQSEVGPLQWLGPSTEKVIETMGRRGERRLLVVPIAFTSDHIETLSELDLEYGALARHAGIEQYERAPALNDRPRFLDALAALVHDHLHRGEVASPQYALPCPGCTNEHCRRIGGRKAQRRGAVPPLPRQLRRSSNGGHCSPAA